MAHRVEAFRNVSDAIRLDSDGEKEIAFLKYLQSIQTLCEYINDQYKAAGHERLVKDVEESKQILSVIKECSERMNYILCSTDTQENIPSSCAPPYEEVFSDCLNSFNMSIMHLDSSTPESKLDPMSVDVKKNTSLKSRSLLSESMKKRNAQLFKIFQQRIESAKDERSRINLKLELHRRLAENRMLAIKKQAEIVREQQKENRLALEKADRATSGALPLTEREQEKRKVFDSVLQYDATQVSPLQMKFITSDSPNFESAKRMFESTIQLKDHPISLWLIHCQMNIKFEIQNALMEYSHLENFLPDKISESNQLYPLTLLQSSKRGSDALNVDDANTLDAISSLSSCLDKISLSIKVAIDDILDVFCLAYKSLLPEDAKAACYRPMEASLLQPLWPSLTLLFRMRNCPCERRIAETISCHLDSRPEDFGVSSDAPTNSDSVYSYAIHQLRLLLTMPSLVDKLTTLVQVSQKLCGENIAVDDDDCRVNGKLLGADDLICMLSYVIVQARIPQLVSECYALEQLMDQKYMLGEEGYSLTSFQTALKYLEMKKLLDSESVSSADLDE